MAALANISHLALTMLNKHLLPENTPLTSASIEPLLPSSQISINFNRSESVPQDHQSTKILVQVGPLSLTVGFREVVFFRRLAESYQEEFAKIPKAEEAEPLPIEAPKQEQPIKKVGYAIDTLQADVKMEPIRLVLMDDTGAIIQHLFSVLLSSLAFKFSTTSLLDENIRKSLREAPEQMKASGKLAMEALFYNNAVSEYEPVMEAWAVEMNVLQTGGDRGKEVLIRADKMLNLNMSYAAAYAIAVAIKKINEGEEAWGKEKEEVKSAHTEIVEKVSYDNRNIEGFIFENRLGYPLTYSAELSCVDSISNP